MKEKKIEMLDKIERNTIFKMLYQSPSLTVYGDVGAITKSVAIQTPRLDSTLCTETNHACHAS